jgi:hypothetical protein
MSTTPTDRDVAYYEWLVDQIDVPQDKSFLHLFERMHNVEFVWLIPNDDNRVEDAIDLRGEFAGSDGHLNLGGATCLEMVVALSRKLGFIASGGGHAKQWAWTLIKNLGLSRFADPMTPDKMERIDLILHDLIWRNYNSDGSGGFFPLQRPDIDQTKVDIWHQLNAYVTEMTDL